MSAHHKSTSVPGLTFSWRRAIGLTRLESKISRETGIPFTRTGRQRKVGELTMHFIGWVFTVGVPALAIFLLWKNAVG